MTDSKDEALLLALERNARASVVELARIIGLSRSATQDRLARLERDGAITGYTIRRRPCLTRERLGAWLTIRHKEGKNCADVLPELRRHPEFVSTFALSGEIDLLVEVNAFDADDLQRLVQAVRALPSVANVTTHVVLATPK